MEARSADSTAVNSVRTACNMYFSYRGWEASEKIKEEIAATKWWQFIRRKKLYNALTNIQMEAFSIGFAQGIQDLVDTEVLTVVKKKKSKKNV